ncbi:MAG: hypothetical protein RLZZ621_1449 [Gemmatimonadota bacterium]
MIVACSSLVLGGAMGCAPAVRSLRGEPTGAVLPETALDARPHQLRFGWRYADETFEARGDGVVRVLAPDRARLDFFLANGMAGGYAVLIGDTLSIPGIDLVRRLLPPPPLLWASLGQVRLPVTPDTAARRYADSLRADFGSLRGRDAASAEGQAWRILFVGRALAQVEHIDGGRLVEQVVRRQADGQWQVQYLHPRAKRRLEITVTDTAFVERFDEAIWRRVSPRDQEP